MKEVSSIKNSKIATKTGRSVAFSEPPRLSYKALACKLPYRVHVDRILTFSAYLAYNVLGKPLGNPRDKARALPRKISSSTEDDDTESEAAKREGPHSYTDGIMGVCSN
jgi:hypothetical protein